MNVVEKNLSGLERTVFYFGTEEVVYKLNYNYIILKRNKEALYYPCGHHASVCRWRAKLLEGEKVNGRGHYMPALHGCMHAAINVRSGRRIPGQGI